MTPKELADEKIVADVFKRPMRHYIFDPPTYPYFPHYYSLDYLVVCIIQRRVFYAI